MAPRKPVTIELPRAVAKALYDLVIANETYSKKGALIAQAQIPLAKALGYWPTPE